MSFRLVIIESPFRNNGNPKIVERNKAYAKLCMLDCLRRHEAPMASHLLYTQVLDETDLGQRNLGIEAGLAWGSVAEATIVYTDLIISEGMSKGILRALNEGRRIYFRRLPPDLMATFQTVA